MLRLKRSMPYSQEEVAEQIGQIADLMKQRLSISGNREHEQEVQRFTDAIAVSQEVLAFMLDENSSRLTKKSVV